MTIAQQLKVKEFPFTIKDSKGNEIYYETSNGSWVKRKYDSRGNDIYSEYFDGYWCKYEYDSNGNQIYFEDSKGRIKDRRPKETTITIDEIATKFNIPVSQLKIKK